MEKTKGGILVSTHSKGLGGRKGAGKGAGEDCLDKERSQEVGLSIEVIPIGIRFGCS